MHIPIPWSEWRGVDLLLKRPLLYAEFILSALLSNAFYSVSFSARLPFPLLYSPLDSLFSPPSPFSSSLVLLLLLLSPFPYPLLHPFFPPPPCHRMPIQPAHTIYTHNSSVIYVYI